MTSYIFSGPSLPPSLASQSPGITWLPPVQQGDVYKAARMRPAMIGIVDGNFETVATVWHKEILWAMAEGVHVYGAASIGALRAAELADFGMQGVGSIFRHFQMAPLADDSEIAVLHGPAELDYVPVTEAMINVRATVAKALQLQVVAPSLATTLIEVAKSLFYKRRTYEAMLDRANELGASHDALHRFARWLEHGQVDQKRQDALDLLKVMSDHLSRGVTPFRANYRMAHTFAWEFACRRVDGSRL
jgi:hypothetical protein